MQTLQRPRASPTSTAHDSWHGTQGWLKTLSTLLAMMHSKGLGFQGFKIHRTAQRGMLYGLHGLWFPGCCWKQQPCSSIMEFPLGPHTHSSLFYSTPLVGG